MMGERTVMQESLFYGFSLEDHVPADHLLRSIDRFVDLSGIREPRLTSDFFNGIGGGSRDRKRQFTFGRLIEQFESVFPRLPLRNEVRSKLDQSFENRPRLKIARHADRVTNNRSDGSS